MVKRLDLRADVPASRELSISLPEDVPVGPAEITLVVRTADHAPNTVLGDLLRSEFFGMWRERMDLQDPAAFARSLREEAWSRPS